MESAKIEEGCIKNYILIHPLYGEVTSKDHLSSLGVLDLEAVTYGHEEVAVIGLLSKC